MNAAMPFIPSSVLSAPQILNRCPALNLTSCTLLFRLSDSLTVPSQTSIPDPGRLSQPRFREILDSRSDDRVLTRVPYDSLVCVATCGMIFGEMLDEWRDAVHSH